MRSGVHSFWRGMDMAMQNGDVLRAGGGWYKDWMTGEEQGPETGVVSAGFANLSWENHQKATEPRSYSEFDVRTFRCHSCPRCAHLCVNSDTAVFLTGNYISLRSR